MKKHLKNIFVAHEGNQFRPHLLHHRSLSYIAIFAIVAKLGLFLLLTLYPGYVLPSDITTRSIINLTNQQRLDNGLPQLKLNSKLAQAASAKAQDMLKYQYFSHYSPTNVSPWYWFNQAGYQYAYAGENLAMDFVTAESLVSAWMSSESHKKNILNSRYTEIGVGVLEGDFKGAKTVLVVQMFGVPPPAPAVVNNTTVDKVVEEKPAQQNITPQIVTEQKLPEVQPEKTVVIPSYVEPDTYDVKVETKEEPAAEPSKVVVKSGENSSELTKTGDQYLGNVKENNTKPMENLDLLMEDKKSEKVVITSLIDTNYFRTTILRPSQLFNSEQLVKFIFYSRNFFMSLMIFLALTLVLNLLIKVRVPHRPTVLYTLLVIYIIGIIIII